MLFQLELCVDLCQIVYNAVSGIERLHANAGQLRIKFSDTLRNSNTTAYDFKVVTAEVVNSLLGAYQLLLMGEKQAAVEILGSVSETSATMKEKSGRRVKEFQLVKNDTASTLEGVTSANEWLYEKLSPRLSIPSDLWKLSLILT